MRGGPSVLDLLQLLGVAVFALSGALEAGRRRMDVFGVTVVALVTALGGGTLRDLLLPARAVFWVADPRPVAVATAVAVLTFFACRPRLLGRPLGPTPRRVLLVADAAGLALFTVLGVQKALACGVAPVVAVAMGVITGVAGGITRDLLCGTVPHVLRREVYATASLAGGLAFLGLGALPLPAAWRTALAMLAVFALRLLALRLGLTLPRSPHSWADRTRETEQGA